MDARTILSSTGEGARVALRKAASDKDHEYKYGSDETYAEPGRHAYPLTDGGKPSRKRTLAAWRYACMPKNGVSSEVKGRIKRFAKEHFGLDLQEDDARKAMKRSRRVAKCASCGGIMKCAGCGASMVAM